MQVQVCSTDQVKSLCPEVDSPKLEQLPFFNVYDFPENPARTVFPPRIQVLCSITSLVHLLGLIIGHAGLSRALCSTSKYIHNYN